MRLPPVAERMMQTEVTCQIGPHLVSAATIFRYSIQRYVDRSSDCLCYTGIQGGAPLRWLDNANDAWIHSRWNHPDFNGALTTGTFVSERFIDSVRKGNSLYAYSRRK